MLEGGGLLRPNSASNDRRTVSNTGIPLLWPADFAALHSAQHLAARLPIFHEKERSESNQPEAKCSNEVQSGDVITYQSRHCNIALMPSSHRHPSTRIFRGSISPTSSLARASCTCKRAEHGRAAATKQRRNKHQRHKSQTLSQPPWRRRCQQELYGIILSVQSVSRLMFPKRLPWLPSAPAPCPTWPS